MTQKILFVDDEPRVLDGLRRQLRRRFQIETANSAKEGLALLKRDGPYAVAVSDLRMPIMDGYETTKKIRELE